jgi:hypothetical protein
VPFGWVDHTVITAQKALYQSTAERSRPGVEVRRRSSAAGRGRNEAVAALTGASRGTVVGQVVVDQAGIRRARDAGRYAARSQSQQGRIPDGRISRVVPDFSCDNRALGSSGRRIVGRHAGAQQVRNRDRGDDQEIATTIKSSIKEKPFCFRISLLSSSPVFFG